MARPHLVVSHAWRMSSRIWYIVAAVLLYAPMGELFYRNYPLAHAPGGGCVEVSRADDQELAIKWGLLVYAVSTALFARRTAGRWAARTSLDAAVALAGGIALAGAYYHVRRWVGPHCVEFPRFCGGFNCGKAPWDETLAIDLVIIALGALLAVPIGWLARKMPPRIRNATAKGEIR